MPKMLLPKGVKPSIPFGPSPMGMVGPTVAAIDEGASLWYLLRPYLTRTAGLAAFDGLKGVYKNYQASLNPPAPQPYEVAFNEGHYGAAKPYDIDLPPQSSIAPIKPLKKSKRK